MINFRYLLIIKVLICLTLHSIAQRSYQTNSVLSTGNWFKFSVIQEGIYKVDVPFLNKLGISGTIPSTQVRIFGNGGSMLPESNAETYLDDLEENSIMIVDGGDGSIEGTDYVLFYAAGPNRWIKDSLNKRFTHQKNLYTEKSFYFITIGGTGQRISTAMNPGPASVQVTSFNERYFHELDTINFLSSGKEWFGEEFSGSPGRTLSRTFTIPFPNLLPLQATLITNVAARSVNTPAKFLTSVNNQLIQQFDIAPVSTGIYDLFAQQVQKTDNFILSSDKATLSFQYLQGSFNSQGWLNWFEFFCMRNLAMDGERQLFFRDWNSVGQGIAGYNISNADNTMQVWDVTDPLHPVKMATTFVAGKLIFNNNAQRLHEYVCFTNQFFQPQVIGKIPNQNLHKTIEKDYLIVTHPEFVTEANRISDFHLKLRKVRTQVVTTEQVYNEFGGGAPDPSAIRNFVKMYYDRYANTWDLSGKYLLLFGKASFDYKNRIANNTGFVPPYESSSSLDPLSTYTSDDFFGFLDNQEDINAGNVFNELDIGIGRIPSKTLGEAKNFVNKLVDYHSATSLGPWRNHFDFVADDEDFNLHLQDAEVLTNTVSATAPVFNLHKIYLDAFRQENGSAGGRYPQVNAMINNNIYSGSLLWNYNGHGGPFRLAEEVILDHQIVNNLNNQYRLPLFLTATCDFAPFDHPTLNSLGENLLVRPQTGAIALMTTTRIVFANSNRIINNNYLRIALEPDADGRYRTLGEAMMAGKNFTYQNSGDIINNRKFTLLGDPAMTLAFPDHLVKLTKVNGSDLNLLTDTLNASEVAVVEGEVTNYKGILLNDFQGTSYISLYDKVQPIKTLGNDPSSPPVSFMNQENLLFRGKATIQNGKFSMRLKLPRDINLQYGSGKFSLYAQNGTEDAHGFSNRIIIGGIATGSDLDDQGPDIKASLNDEKFVNGSITNANPVLLVKLSDSSGINTGGSAVGHDIVATIDGDNNQYFVLNNFYETELDNYQKGTLRFQLPQLPPGPHSIKIKAWDLVNNSSEIILDFIIVNDEEFKIEHVLNYPNPFTTKTSFWFEHNYPGTELSARVDIFTVTGKQIKTIVQTINTPGNRSIELEWDGRDGYLNKIGKGVYIYRLRVKTPDGKTAEKWQRLVILGK